MASRLSRMVAMCLVLVLAASAAALAANNGSDPDPDPVDGGVARLGPAGIQLHDTIWELTLRATTNQADDYFTYLANKGYDGAWLSLFPGAAASIFAENRNGNVIATINGDGDFDVNADYITDVRAILDKAVLRGIDIYLVPIWGVAHIHDNTDGFCAGLNDGVLNAANAEDLGEQLAAGLADHPGITAWVYGGDNWCPPELAPEDVNIWRNLDAGMITGGATQPVGYHSPNGADLRFKDEAWLDFHAMQTAHCTLDGALRSRFDAAIAGSSKPVWAAEMRYEGMAPTFCTADQVAAGAASPSNPVDENNVLADSLDAFNAGVTGLVYGHNERWQWSVGAHGSSGTLWQGVQDSFNAPGENLTVQLLATGVPPSTTTTTTAAPNNQPTISLSNPHPSGVDVGTQMTFTASASDPDETISSSQISWRIESIKAGTTVELSNAMTGASINYTAPNPTATPAPYTLRVTATVVDSNGGADDTSVDIAIRAQEPTPTNGGVDVGYSALDSAILESAAAYLGTSGAEFQKTGIFVARFLTYLGNRQDSPQPIATADLPSTTGAVSVVTEWGQDEVEALDWMRSYFSVNNAEAHRVGAALLAFLVSIERG